MSRQQRSMLWFVSETIAGDQRSYQWGLTKTIRSNCDNGLGILLAVKIDGAQKTKQHELAEKLQSGRRVRLM